MKHLVWNVYRQGAILCNMHIGIDGRLTYYRTGGISTYIRRLIEALEILDTDNRYTVFHSRKAQDSLVTRFQQAKLWTPCHHRLERTGLTVELARFNLDILHSPDFIPPWHGAKRHVITVHDLNFLHYPDLLTAESRRYYNDQIVAAVRQADHILADSEATKADIVEMLGVPAAKITVHMLGVEERFRPLPDESLQTFYREYDLPAQYILFVGTFEPRKNIGGLLAAYRALRNELPDAPPIVLAGRRGWMFDETMARIRQMGLDAHIHWRENIPDDALPALYNGAQVLVTPSFYEGFGLPALEAMACGTVPIVSNRSSLPEVVGDIGLQINPDDPTTLTQALYHALTDSGWLRRMQVAALERARLFTWSHTAAITLSVYRSLI
ncbi:MAG: glycosyltransferase family 4 protein [Anaerolineaceae bacterium]|nr:glycosyltransferase family 4 protein [Anaerolineaceae bacterium]